MSPSTLNWPLSHFQTNHLSPEKKKRKEKQGDHSRYHIISPYLTRGKITKTEHARTHLQTLSAARQFDHNTQGSGVLLLLDRLPPPPLSTTVSSERRSHRLETQKNTAALEHREGACPMAGQARLALLSVGGDSAACRAFEKGQPQAYKVCRLVPAPSSRCKNLSFFSAVLILPRVNQKKVLVKRPHLTAP